MGSSDRVLEYAVLCGTCDLDSALSSIFLSKTTGTSSHRLKNSFNYFNKSKYNSKNIDKLLEIHKVLNEKLSNSEDKKRPFQYYSFVFVGSIHSWLIDAITAEAHSVVFLKSTNVLSLFEVVLEWVGAESLDASKMPHDWRDATLASHLEFTEWSRRTISAEVEKYNEYRAINVAISNNPELAREISSNGNLCINDFADAKQHLALIQQIATGPNDGNFVLKTLATNRSPWNSRQKPAFDLMLANDHLLAAVADGVDHKHRGEENGPERTLLAIGTKRSGNLSRQIGNGDKLKLNRLAFYADTTTVQQVASIAFADGFVVLPDLTRGMSKRPGIFLEPSRAESSESDISDQISLLADKIISSVLHGNRPVERYRSHFFAAFDDHDGKAAAALSGKKLPEAKTQTLTNSTNDERDYFLPELRPRLMGENDNRLLTTRSVELTVTPGAAISVDHGNYDVPLENQLVGARLHTCNGTLVLEWIVEGANEKELRDARDDALKEQNNADIDAEHKAVANVSVTALDLRSKSLWAQIIEGNIANKSLAQAIDFNAEARFTYFNYRRVSAVSPKDGKPTRIILKMGDDRHVVEFDTKAAMNSERSEYRVANRPIVLALLELGLDKSDAARLVVNQLTDDRARVLTSMILFGNPPSIAVGKRAETVALSQINVVDPYDTEFAYAGQTSSDELAASTYERFVHWGSHFLMTDHSLAFVGYRGGNRKPSEWPSQPNAQPANFAFAESHIHQDHMAGVYRRLFLHFLFLEAQLRSIARQLTALENGLPNKASVLPKHQHQRIADLRYRMAMSASNMRQGTLSTQMQGSELHTQLALRFKLDAEWERLDKKILALEELVEASAERRRESMLAALTMAGLPLVLVGVALQAIPIFYDGPGSNLAGNWVDLAAIVAFAIIVSFVGMILWNNNSPPD